MRSRPKLFVTLFVLIAAPAVMLATLSNQDEKARRTQPREEATVVQEGVLTAKEKSHSRLFEKPGKTKLKDQAKGNVETGEDIPLRISKYSNADEYLRDLTCQSDAVVEGSVEGKASQITEQGTSIFTSYQLTVKNVLKNNAGAPVEPNSAVTVVRAGGAVNLNGRVLRDLYNSRPPFATGKTYILFLKFIPDTGSYITTGASGENSFQVEGNRVTQVSEEALPLGGPNAPVDRTAFQNQILTALNTPCSN